MKNIFHCVVYKDPEHIYKYGTTLSAEQLVEHYEEATANTEDTVFLRTLLRKGRGDKVIKFIADAWGLSVTIYKKVYEYRINNSDKIGVWQS
jgi:hypothetical protein